MGPTALFDKSFLQGLSLDESVWFDNFFIAVVCPIFYAETLADLSKSPANRTAEDEVRIIADKFPDRSGQPNAYHLSACLAELVGQTIPLTGQILISGGKPITTSQGPAVVVEQTDEAKAFARWGSGEFESLEYEYAQAWRAALPTIDPEASAALLSASCIDISACRTLDDAKQIAEGLVEGTETVLDPFQFVFSVLHPPTEMHERIIRAWQSAGCPPLATYAPYTAFVVSLQYFFHLAVAKGLISTRRSNTMDIAYLFYLPFCQMFVSSDRLHRRVAPLFVRDDQMFVWGPDLKADFARLNSHYQQLPVETRDQGVIRFAAQPPTDGGFLVAAIWDRLFPGWRERKDTSEDASEFDVMALFKELKERAEAPSTPATAGATGTNELEMISVQRRVRRKKGSWYQVPKDLEVSED